MEPNLVELCVQGTVFLLPNDELMNHDWLVGRMLSSTIPATRTSTGALYLNADADSFRVIFSVLSGVFTLDDEKLNMLYNSKVTSWQLMKETAKYLGCISISERMESYEGARLQQQSFCLETMLRSVPDVTASSYSCPRCRRSAFLFTSFQVIENLTFEVKCACTGISISVIIQGQKSKANDRAKDFCSFIDKCK
jgi:hypothetical protein